MWFLESWSSEIHILYLIHHLALSVLYKKSKQKQGNEWGWLSWYSGSWKKMESTTWKQNGVINKMELFGSVIGSSFKPYCQAIIPFHWNWVLKKFRFFLHWFLAQICSPWFCIGSSKPEDQLQRFQHVRSIHSPNTQMNRQAVVNKRDIRFIAESGKVSKPLGPFWGTDMSFTFK
jgi:hypothetical protein